MRARAVVLGLVLGGLPLLFPAACGSPTYIALEVRTRPELCTNSDLRLNEVGVAVTTASRVDDPARAPLQQFENGCSNARTGQVGTLVITPSGERNAEVAIRVVVGLNDNSATDCDDDEGRALKNCIISKRIVRFVEGASVPVTVMIEPDCNGVQCPADLVCVRGRGCSAIEQIPNNPNSEPDANVITDATGISEVEPARKDGN